MALPFATVPASQRPYCVNVRFEVQPDKLDQALSLLRGDQEGAHSEKGNLQFVVGQDMKKPNAIFIHEEYSNEDSFNAHVAADYCQKFFKWAETNPFTDGGAPVMETYLGEFEPKKRALTPGIFINATLSCKPSVRAEFLPKFMANAKGANNDEPGCKQFVWGESTIEPNTFHLHEEYEGKEALAAHSKSAHFQAWSKYSG